MEGKSVNKEVKKARRRELRFWRRFCSTCFGDWDCLLGGEEGTTRYRFCRIKRECERYAEEEVKKKPKEEI